MRKPRWVSVVAAALMVVMLSPSSAYAVDLEISVSCMMDAGASFVELANVGSSVQVTATDCVMMVIFDADGVPTDPTAIGPAEVVVVPAGSMLVVSAAPDMSDQVTVLVKAVYPDHVPSGELVLTEDIVIGTNPPVMNVGEVWAPDEYEHRLGGREMCEIEAEATLGAGSDHVYGTLEIVISRSGRYTFRNVATSPPGYEVGETDHPISDPFMALYSSFDPSLPDDGVVGCNDDMNDKPWYEGAIRTTAGVIMEGHRPYFSAHLEPGTYTLFYATWESMNHEMWTTGEDGAWDPGAATGTFEMWGPVDSICLGDDAACIEEQAVPELPATGSSSGTSLWAALMAVVVGGGLAVAGRRSVRRA